jgi:hypothetical protein
MKENHDLGEAVAALAALSGATKVEAAIQAANFLAALTGPRGGIVCLGEEVQPIGASMISVGGDSPEQARMTELLVSPLRFLQEDLIDYSRRVEPKLRDRLATSLADPHYKDYGQRRAVVESDLAEAEQETCDRAGRKVHADGLYLSSRRSLRRPPAQLWDDTRATGERRIHRG